MNKVIYTIAYMMLTCLTSTTYAQDIIDAVSFELDGKPLNGKIQIVNNYNIVIEDVTFENGLRKGIKKRYYSNGLLFLEGKYVEGKREGVHKSYYENGKQKAVYSYKNGLQDGLSRFYEDDGHLYSDDLYKNGIREQATSYYENGKAKYLRTFVDGVQTEEVKYTDKGKIDEKTFFINGEAVRIEYYKNGKFDYNFDLY
ncbi:MAG: hypothetical protein LBE34_08340 [Flavobacteriaceae bacterium]|jgi:antitoxin component YwqK of YwqJK toxin-antitoxin module|nr:hypothetical protein [Flavobacteriaceae bacterium]